MVIGATTDLIKIMSNWLRRADSELVTNAARNAAHSMNAHQFRQLDDLRTLRDLESIPAATVDVSEPSRAQAFPH